MPTRLLLRAAAPTSKRVHSFVPSSRNLFTRRQAQPPSFGSRLKTGVVTVGGVATGILFAFYGSDSRAGIHEWLFPPLLRYMTEDDPEKGHRWAVCLLKSGVCPRDTGVDDDVLSFELWDKQFTNPIGVAAGFDKHAECIDSLFDLGFGYVEVGSVTPEPQAGNPKPRVFRIPEAEAVLNRYGFNSVGHEAVVAELRNRVRHFIQHNAHKLPSSLFPPLPSTPASDSVDSVSALLASEQGEQAKLTDKLGLPRSLSPGRVLAVNLGKNKTSDPDSVQDFVQGVRKLGPYADALVINISSPNTSGLRGLQRKGVLNELLAAVLKERDQLAGVKPPLLVKIAPDLSHEELYDIGQAALESGVNGMIVSNTTTSRPESAGVSPVLAEAGGLSGRPLKPLSLQALSTLYKATEAKVPLIGAGGISSAQDAIDFAKAGATFVQLYTALTYQGLGLPRKIKDQVADYLHQNNMHWTDLVGSDVSQTDLLASIEENKLKKETQSWTNALNDAKHELGSIINAIAKLETPSPSSSSSSSSPSSSSSQSEPQQQVTAIPTSLPKEDSSQQNNETPKTLGPLSGLFSSFGERPNASDSKKRIV